MVGTGHYSNKCGTCRRRKLKCGMYDENAFADVGLYNRSQAKKSQYACGASVPGLSVMGTPRTTDGLMKVELRQCTIAKQLLIVSR